MRLPRYLVFVLLLFSFEPACTRRAPTHAPVSSTDAPAQLRSDLDRLFADTRLVHAQICVNVTALDREEVLYSRNPQQLFTPASTNKVITAAVALMRLGPEYRFQTRIVTKGQVENGTLNDDLIIVGSGDPSCSPRFHQGDPFAVFKNWAATLKLKNILAISGSILGDDTAFQEAGLGLGWEWNDLPYAYAARAGALQFNDNLITLEFKPGTENGSPANIRMSPLENYLSIENRTVTVEQEKPEEIGIEYGDSNESMRISGTIPAKEENAQQNVAVRNPTGFYMSALARVLSEEGISAKGWGVAKPASYGSPEYSLLWSHASPPLPEILKPLLKNSQNLYAETLVRTLGMTLRGHGTFVKGKDVVEETLTQVGIPGGTYMFADGSGLSRLNLQTADSLVRLLRHMYQDRNFQIFYQSLPVAGVDGTLSARMQKTAAENNVHAKTGSMSNVSCICGYLKTADSEMLAFSIAINNSLAPKQVSELIQDKALERLVEFSRNSKSNR